MGRRKKASTLRKEAEQKEINRTKSVYDMSKYKPKKFKKAKKRSEKSVYGGISKVRKTSKIDWI